MIYYPWQKNQWEKLSRQFLQHQLPHALLLTGIKGLGKFQFAKKFSQFILCSSPRENQSCGVCRNCHLFETNNHPDFFPPYRGDRAAQFCLLPKAHKSAPGQSAS